MLKYAASCLKLRAFTTTIQRYSCAMNGIAGLRLNYKLSHKYPIHIDALPSKDPMRLFHLWFEEARESQEILEANAMTLATCTQSGFPSARTVLLKGFDEKGFVFFTNYKSRKGCEIAENHNVALVFHWAPLHQDVRIEGVASQLPQSESIEYFHSRPHGSQIGACISNQSEPIPSAQVLTDRFKEFSELYPTQDHIVEKPEHWGGYLVTPRVMEFWQGQPNRIHSRLQFIRSNNQLTESDILHKGDDNWFYQLLSP